MFIPDPYIFDEWRSLDGIMSLWKRKQTPIARYTEGWMIEDEEDLFATYMDFYFIYHPRKHTVEVIIIIDACFSWGEKLTEIGGILK